MRRKHDIGIGLDIDFIATILELRFQIFVVLHEYRRLEMVGCAGHWRRLFAFSYAPRKVLGSIALQSRSTEAVHPY